MTQTNQLFRDFELNLLEPLSLRWWSDSPALHFFCRVAQIAPVRIKSPPLWLCQWIKAALSFTAFPHLSNTHPSIFSTALYFLHSSTALRKLPPTRASRYPVISLVICTKLRLTPPVYSYSCRLSLSGSSPLRPFFYPFLSRFMSPSICLTFLIYRRLVLFPLVLRVSLRHQVFWFARLSVQLCTVKLSYGCGSDRPFTGSTVRVPVWKHTRGIDLLTQVF